MYLCKDCDFFYDKRGCLENFETTSFKAYFFKVILFQERHELLVISIFCKLQIMQCFIRHRTI